MAPLVEIVLGEKSTDIKVNGKVAVTVTGWGEALEWVNEYNKRIGYKLDALNPVYISTK